MRPLRLAVCGARFGEVYLKALADGVPGIVLSGVLARGSARARRLAAHLGVPLWQEVSEAVAASDAAAVVVRSAASGGSGTALASAFLEAGLPVLMEHPLHPAELQRLLDLAARRGVRLHVNSVYPHLPAARHFIAAARAWRDVPREEGMPAYAQLTTSRQLLYSALDVLARALGGLGDFRLERPAGMAEGQPFAVLEGTAGGLPLGLRLQSYLDPRDADQHSLAMHHIVLGGPEGSLSLASSFGPVVRSRPLYVPGYADGACSILLDEEGPAEAAAYLDSPMLAVEAAAPLTGRAALREALPGAVAVALADFAREIGGGPDAERQSPAALMEVSRAWQIAGQTAGPPALRPLAPPWPPGRIGLAAPTAPVPPVASPPPDEAPTPDAMLEINTRVYAELDRLLSARGMAGQALFMNWGYVPDVGEVGEAAFAPPPHHPQQPQWRLVLEVLGQAVPEDADVLDVGCGRGGALVVLARQFACGSLSGLDIGEANIAHCRRHPDLASARFQRGDACRLPYPDASFDVVVNIESSCAYPDFPAFLRHVRRVLRPDGCLVLADLVPAEAEPAMREGWAAHGFILRQERDLTAGVLRGRKAGAGAEDTVFDRLADATPELAAFLDTYRAGPGTPMYRALDEGRVSYRLYRLERSGSPIPADPPPLPDRGAMLRGLLAAAL
ncbi:Gfo/Idh/MocA family oxidoreductase [Enterovirga rhinocerotis]|uniref:Thiazolinyl imide reductase n=1 Tax=Enterovirga rhinocerotis TaxID=1339210 RepID=A0A4R7C8P6_9HYPH|nr:Gfo/Idh/MocA family oxidoreductase [Enterovirga rhinocerotis]TDR95020.1 thiazolinyl imide reductase [Enterovirga rhinocerotis]